MIEMKTESGSNKIIEDLLQRKGYTLKGFSETGKHAKNFEKNELSSRMFNLMIKDQFYRLLFQLLFKKPISTISEIIGNMKINLSYTIKESTIKKITCKHCNSLILRFPKYDKPKNIRCQKCGRREYKVEDDWDMEMDLYPIVTHYLVEAKEKGILDKINEFYCPLCLKASTYKRDSEIRKSKRILFCDKCNSLKEIRWIFTSPEDIRKFWESGAWLEWYVKRLLENNGFSVLQGVKVSDAEVDCILAESDRLISIECKVKNFKNTYKDDPEITKLLPFSDCVIFVTTTKVSETIVRRYKRIEPTCEKLFVSGYEIDDLPNLINKKLRSKKRR